MGFGVDFGVNTGDVREADEVKRADGCVYLSSQVNRRRRRKLKRLDTDRSLTAAGSQVQWVGRPWGAGRHGVTQGDGVGEVDRRNKCQKKRVVEGR